MVKNLFCGSPSLASTQNCPKLSVCTLKIDLKLKGQGHCRNRKTITLEKNKKTCHQKNLSSVTGGVTPTAVRPYVDPHPI